MRVRSETGQYRFYDYDLPYEDDDDAYAGGSKHSCSLCHGDAKREHEHIVGILEKTKIIRVYDREGNLLEERIDKSVQQQIDKLNDAYAKEQAKNKKRRLILAKRKSRK